MSNSLIIAISLACAAIGTGLGFLLARYRHALCVQSLAEKERQIRHMRVQLHQDSRHESTAQGPTLNQEDSILAQDPKEELEQARLDLLLLREDKRIELALFREENEQLRSDLDRFNSASAQFVDVVPSDHKEPQEPDVIVGAGWVEEPEVISIAAEKDSDSAIKPPNEVIPDSEPVSAETEPSEESTELAIHWEPPSRKLSPILDSPNERIEGDRMGSDHTSTNPLPVYQPLSIIMKHWATPNVIDSGPESGIRTESTLIRSIVQLSDDGFELLSQLGYATLDKLADLSPSEIRRLAAIFRINEMDIDQGWMPAAKAHRNRETS